MSGFDVKRYDHGSRVPGWDDSVDLSKPPATVPDPALTPVPDALRQGIERRKPLVQFVADDARNSRDHP